MNPLSKIDASSVLATFSTLSDVYIFMKDRAGRFIGANAMQLKKLGLSAESDLIGKTDYDFFPSYMIARYTRDDTQVMETKEPILRRTELVANPDGSISWHITTKFPLLDHDGECVGIIGYMRDFERSEDTWLPYQRMNATVQYIREKYAAPIQVADVAKHAGLPGSQFERRFTTVFQQSPYSLLNRYALARTSQLLVITD